MANNSLLFSEVIPQLTAHEEVWLRRQSKWIAVKDGQEKEIDGPDEAVDGQWMGPRFLRDNEEYDPAYGELGFEFGFHDDHDTPDGWGHHFWVYSHESGEPYQVAWLVHKFLKEFRPAQCWSLTYCTSCSKPHVGEFAGGAVFVTAREICWQNAYDFVERHRQAFRNQADGVDTGSGSQDGNSGCGQKYLLYDFDADELASRRIYSPRRHKMLPCSTT